jgi:hypothetical protein
MAIYTQEQVDNAVRKSISPSRLASYLPVASPYITPALVAGTPTKLLLPTTVKAVQDFTLDLINSRWYLDSPGVVNREFSIAMTSSVLASTNNTVMTFELYKNGVFEEGVSIQRKIVAGSDVGALGILGTLFLSTNDYIELYVTSSLGGTITFQRTAINLMEIN